LVVLENDVLNSETLELISIESSPPPEGGAAGDGGDTFAVAAATPFSFLCILDVHLIGPCGPKGRRTGCLKLLAGRLCRRRRCIWKVYYRHLRLGLHGGSAFFHRSPSSASFVHGRPVQCRERLALCAGAMPHLALVENPQLSSRMVRAGSVKIKKGNL
jgi:hypothetical protein